MGASQRTKGAGGERELCALLSDQFGIPVKRVLGQARDGGHDINLTPFYVEVKRRKRIALLYEAMAQAERDRDSAYAVGQATPIVALRGDGKPWLVVMHFADWCKLAREEIAK